MPLHPAIVHLPIALAVLVPLVTLGVLIGWARGALRRRAWAIAIAFQALLVGSGFLAMQTGDREEDRVESVVAESAIESHEEAAERFVYAGAAVLVLMLVAGVLPRERAGRAVGGAAVAGTLAVLGLGYLTGQAGGELVYRHGAASAYQSHDASTSPGAVGTNSEHDRSAP